MAVPNLPNRMHFGRLIGIKFILAKEGRSRCLLEVGEQHHNPNGIVHGGVTYSMVDQAMGAAVYSALPKDEYASTLEIKINYLRTAKDGRLDCEGWLVQREGTLALLEAEVRQGEALVAKALGTYLVMPRPAKLDAAPREHT
jgi:acyl-CoA thioesterase